MLRPLPALKDFVYLANSPESAATFRDLVPLLSLEGINENRQYHLPHITSLNIDVTYMPEPWMIKQVWEVMFEGCDLTELQTLALSLSDDDIPSDCYDRLLQCLFLHGHHLKSICLDLKGINTSPLLTAISKYCTSLEHWELKNLTIQDSAFTCLTLPNTLPHFHSLALYCVSMSNENIEMICRSSVASQLTKLSVIDDYRLFLSLEAYHWIVHSFPRLQSLEIHMPFLINRTKDAAVVRNRVRNIVQWLDELFSRQCVFTDTIETMSLTISDNPSHFLDWTVKENASFTNELFHDHMLKHWHFPFPALQSFAMIWPINHPHMNDLMARRLLNCTKLHSMKLELDLWKSESGNQHLMLNIKNRPEVIRQMREKSLLNE